MKSVDIPGVGTVDFPDEMSDADIGHTIDKEIMPSVKAQADEQKRIDDYWSGRGSQEDAGDGRPGIFTQFGRDLGRGVSQVQQLGYGLGGLAADALGADETARSWLQSYQDIGQDIQQNNPPTIGTYKNIHGVEDAFRYGVEAIGENALMAVPSLVTGGLGAVGLRSLAQKGAAELVESLVAKGVARDVAEKQAVSYLAKAATVGGVAGAYPPAAGMEMGSIYGDVYEQTGVQAPGTAATLGAIAGALDVVGEGLALRRVFGRELSETAARSLVSRLGIAGAEQFVTEAPTEALQTILERTGVALQDPSKAVFSQQGIEDIINAGLKGGIGGAGVGVVAESTGSIMDWAKRRGVEPTQENLQTAAAAGDSEAIEILKASGVMSDEQLAALSPEAATRFAERYQGRRAAEEDPVLAAQRTQAAVENRDLEGGDTLPNQQSNRMTDQGGIRREGILKTYDIATQQVDAAIEAGQIKPEQREAAIRERAVGLMPELDQRAQADARTVAAARARINEILTTPASAHTPELATEYLELNNLVHQSERKSVIQLGRTRAYDKQTSGSTEDAGLRQAVDTYGRQRLLAYNPPRGASDAEVAYAQAVARRTQEEAARNQAPLTEILDNKAEGATLRPAPDTAFGSETRLPQNRDQLADERQAAETFRRVVGKQGPIPGKEDLVTGQRLRAGPDVRDTRAGGRPEGGVESQRIIDLDEGRPVEILSRRTVPNSKGEGVSKVMVRRYDPRTGQPDLDENGEAFEYEVPEAKLTQSRYAVDPRQAQQFEEKGAALTGKVAPYVVEPHRDARGKIVTSDAVGRTTKPEAAGQRIDEVQGLKRQTYRTTDPDPTVPGAEGPTSELPGQGPVPRAPRPDQGAGGDYDYKSGGKGPFSRGDQTTAEASARRGATREAPFTAPEAPRNDTVSTSEQRHNDTETTPVRNPEQLVASVEKGLRDRQVKPNPKAIAQHFEVSEAAAANALAAIAGRGNTVIRQVKPNRKELEKMRKGEGDAPKAPRYRLTPQFDEDMSLLEFLMSKGGLAANGDLTAMDAHRKTHPRYGNLVRKQGGGGMSLDEARELAEGEGFIGQGTDDYNTTTERDLLEAIDDELRGNRVKAERTGSGSERDQMEARARELGIEVNPDWNDAELMVEIGEADAIANADNPTVEAADHLREVVDAMLVEMGIVPDTYAADFDIPPSLSPGKGAGYSNDTQARFSSDIPFGDDSAGSDQGAGEVGTEAESAAEAAVDGAGRQAPDVRSGDRAAETRAGNAEETGRERREPRVEKTDQGDQYVLPGEVGDLSGAETLKGKGPQKRADEGLFAEKTEPEPEQIDLEDAIAAAKVDVPAKGEQREVDGTIVVATGNPDYPWAAGRYVEKTKTWVPDKVLGVGDTPEEAAKDSREKTFKRVAEYEEQRKADEFREDMVKNAKLGRTLFPADVKKLTKFGDGKVSTGDAKAFLRDMGLTAKQANKVVDQTTELDVTSGGARLYDLARIVRTGQNVLDVAEVVNKTAAPKAETKPKSKKPPKRKERAALLSRLFGRDPNAELTADQEAADDAAWKERLEQIAPRAETVADIERILDENVERGILSKGTAKGIKSILARMPTEGLKGVRLMIQDRMTAEEREILGTAKGVSGEYFTLADDPDTRVLTVLGENGSKDAVETFIHENAHVIFGALSAPDKALARQIYDRLPISRQAMHTVGYDKDAQFEEWFAESAVDYYAGGLKTDGPRAGIAHMLGGLMQRLFKRVIDTFSNEKAQIDAFFSGLERSLGYAGPVSVDGITRRERRGVSTLAILSNPIGAITGDWKAWRSGFQELHRDVTEAWKSPRPNRQNAAAGLARWWFYSADGEFRAAIGKFSSPTLNLLADTFHAQAGSSHGLDRKLASKLGMKLASNATFDEATTRKTSIELQQLDRTLRDFRKDPAAMDRIVDLVQNPARRRSDPESKAASEIARQLKSLHTYMVDAGVDLGTVKSGYFPREVDSSAVLKDPTGFVDAAAKAYRASGLGTKEAQAAADAWLTNVLYGGAGSPLNERKGSTPSFVQSRVLSKQADEILKNYYQRDVDLILGSYISRAAKRAEIARRFGDGFKNWEKIEKQIREEDPAAAGMLGHLQSYAATAAGVRHDSVSGLIRQGSSLVRTVTSVSLLEKSTLTSLAEAIMPALRTGSAKDFLPAITKTLSEFRRELRHMPPTVAAELAADIGAIAGSGTNSIMAARFAGGDPLGRGQARVLSKYFRRIGLEQWTDATRIAATERGAVFIRRLAKDIAGNGLNPKSARIYMEEMGIQKDQLDAFVTYVNGFGDTLPTASDLDKGGEMGAAYRVSLLRFVDQTILRPTSTTRPRWASHPVGAVLFQLQAFSYAFSKNVLLRDLRLAKTALTEKDMGLVDRILLAAPLMMMLPALAMVQAIIGEMRDWLLMDPERYKAQTRTAKIEKAISRAGLTGALDPYVQMLSGARYQKDPLSALTGPFLGVVGSGLGALQQYIGNNSPSTNASERRVSEALYDTLFEPMVNIMLGYSPASPLATLITMGLIPGLRDEFVNGVAGPRIGHTQPKIFGVSELLAGKQFKSKSGSWAAGG